VNLRVFMLLGVLLGALLGPGCLSSNIQVDGDADGVTSEDGDCNDYNPDINPNATEVCDGEDNDCDGTIDENDASDASNWYTDADGDGFGDSHDTGSARSCDRIPGYSANNLDCDDRDINTNPNATEVCDGYDNDCNGVADEGYDGDGDGYSECEGDCNDGDGSIYPGALESCADGVDSDCDGEEDAGADLDEDGYTECEGDCDDGNPLVSPGIAENCTDGIDNNCNQQIDEDVDQDQDGFNTCAGEAKAADCNDNNPDINPDAEDICDGLDNNCDGSIDPGFDQDNDGYSTCGGDCDDARDDIHPGVEETCNGVDDDCDFTVDDGLTTLYYPDADGDGYGATSGEPIDSCGNVEGYVDNALDCDDTSELSHPEGQEVCDGNDNDCNGKVDESFFQGPGMQDKCGIHLILPSDRAQAVPSGFQVTIDFDSSNAESNEQPYALEDPAYIWLKVTGSDGSVQRTDNEVQELGLPASNIDIPTRITWPVGLEINPGVTYTLELTECQVPCVDPGDGWVIYGRSVFSGAAPCGVAFNIKNGMEITKMGSTNAVTLEGMNWDIQNSSAQLALYLLDTAETTELPIDSLSIGQGPIDGKDSYSVSQAWGVPVVLPAASIGVDGQLLTNERDIGLVVPMLAGNLILYVQDSVATATVGSSGGRINSLSNYKMTGSVHRDDMHKLLVEAGLEGIEWQIVYDTDTDGDGTKDSAEMIIESTPTYVGDLNGMSSSCQD